MPIVFSQIRAFHAVAEHRGFTAAARVLGVGQPTLTIQVKELEETYGVELFLRKGRQLELTDTGRALLEATRGIMKFCDEAHDVLTAYGRFDIGALRLATVGPFHATEILARFRQLYPKTTISTLLGNSERTLRRVVDFEADVGILAHVADDPRVEMAPYRKHRVIAFVNGSHPWFSRRSVTLKELAEQPFVLRERGSTTRSAFENALKERGLKVTPVFEIESREGVWKAVERGLGVSVVADFEFVPHENLASLEIEDCEIVTRYFIAYLRDRVRSPIVRNFMHTIADMERHAGRGPAK